MTCDRSQETEVVVTPGGPRRVDQVHRVGSEQVVTIDDDGNMIVSTAVQEKFAMSGNATEAADLVLTPGGFRNRAFVHHIGDGQALNLVKNRRFELRDLRTGVTAELAEPPQAAGATVPAIGSGWITYAYWNNGTGSPISQFTTMWQVPPAPSSGIAGETIFLFNGIQNYGANFGILQPVLQWGPSAAGGGQYWAVASWYVTSSGQAFHTNLVQVNPGDMLIGVMTQTGRAGTQFNYTSEFRGIAGTTLPVQNIAELQWCNQTLEAYGLQSCANYPYTPQTQFTEIFLRTGSTTPAVSWTPVNRVTDCGQHAAAISNSATYGEVDVYYSQALADEEAVVARANADGRLEAFGIGTDNGLWHQWQLAPGGGWSGWASLGGSITSMLDVQRNLDGRLEAFARGTDNALWHTWQTSAGSGWSGWSPLGGILYSDPCAIPNADGRLEVFARGTDDALWHRWQSAPGAGWSNWVSLGGVLTTEPVVTRNADGRIEVFARGTDGALYHIWQTTPNGGWSNWSSLGGVITSDPAPSRNADGRLEVFVRGSDNALWHTWQTSPGGGWSGRNSLGGILTSDPACSRNSDGRLEVFGRGTDNALWHIWQTTAGGGWSTWSSLGGVVTSVPTVGNNKDGRLEAFARGTDNALWHTWQTSPGGGWSGWNSLAGRLLSL
jgi:acylphosphatase